MFCNRWPSSCVCNYRYSSLRCCCVPVVPAFWKYKKKNNKKNTASVLVFPHLPSSSGGQPLTFLKYLPVS